MNTKIQSYSQKQTEEETLGERLRRVRGELCMSQVQVAKMLHVTPGFICNIEKGRTAVSLRLLILYAQLLHTTLDSLVGTLEPGYHNIAIENELLTVFSALDEGKQKKLLQTLHIWVE